MGKPQKGKGQKGNAKKGKPPGPSVAGKKRKLHVEFNEDDRTEWLTGFRKRKLARREFGISMGKLKERKAQLELKKANREKLKPYLQEVEKQMANLEESITAHSSDIETKEFDDEATKEKFGERVLVTTSFGLPQDSDEEEEERERDMDEAAEEEVEGLKTGKKLLSKSKEKEMTLFQRIQMKTKGLAAQKKKKKGPAKKKGGSQAAESKPAVRRSSHKQRRKRK